MLSELFLALLEQDQIWRTSDGYTLPLEDLSPAHRRSVLAMLEARAGADYGAWVDELIADGYRDEELAALGVSTASVETGSHEPDWVAAWFEAQPLVRRLRQLEGEGDATATVRPTAADHP